MNSETTSLISAIAAADETKVNSLIAEGVDLNKSSERQISPIHTAVIYNRVKILNILLENGANVNAVTVNNETALHLGALNGHIECVDILLKYGSDVNALSIDGHTALHLSMVMKAANNRKPMDAKLKEMISMFDQIIEVLISHKDTDVSLTMKNGFDCVTFAITAEDCFAIEMLLKKCPQLFYTKKDGHYSLHVAILFGNCSVVTLILNIVNDVNIKNDKGLTSLHYAVLLRQTEMVELLVSKGADLDAVDDENNTALHFALTKANEELQLKTSEAIVVKEGSITADILERLMNAGIKRSVSLAIAGFLIQEGADYLFENTVGQIPLDVIRKQGFHLRGTFLHCVIEKMQKLNLRTFSMDG